MSKINFRNIKIGQLIKCKHLDDNGKKAFHIFLVISISKSYFYAVQCSSVKWEDGESYFSRNDFAFYGIRLSAFKYETHIGLRTFHRIEFHQIKCVLNMSKKLEFLEICNELLDSSWENSKSFNHNQILDLIKCGKQNYNWTPVNLSN